MSSPTNIKTGAYTGTDAAQLIELGFRPNYVRIVNTDGAAVDEHFDGMDDGTSYTSATDAAAGSVRASPDGVTLTAGSAGESAGFRVGAALSEDGVEYNYIAIQNGPGSNSTATS